MDFIEDMHDMPIEDTFNEQPYHNLVEEINATMLDMHWYDRQLFLLYVNSGKSMRRIASETGISLTSINNTIQNVKRTIQEEHEDRYKKTKKKS